MTFWDSSAIVPLLVREATSESMLTLLQEDREIAVWWGTETECLSALARCEREGKLTRADVTKADSTLKNLLAGAHEILPGNEVRRYSRRLLMTHPLRAADSLQLAAALLLAGEHPEQLLFITLDRQLAGVAQREGFPTLPPE